MNKTLSSAIAFVAGAAIGSFVTWKLLNKTYERRIQEETDELRKYYGKTEPEAEVEDGPELSEELNDILVNEGYVPYSSDVRRDSDTAKKPYIISGKDFDTLDNYDAETLTYFADGVLADDANHRIEDVESMVGKDNLRHFGDDEKDPDTIYIRNEGRMTDYEILYDASTYEECAVSD